jgi:hypothetical protein
VALDLEVAGTVYELTEPAEEAAKERPLVRLRDSHHTVARLFAHGLRPEEVSGQTGYSPSRLSTLQRDPSFQELVTFYRMDAREAKQDVEMQMLHRPLPLSCPLHLALHLATQAKHQAPILAKQQAQAKNQARPQASSFPQAPIQASSQAPGTVRGWTTSTPS